jgi:uncharacterized protein YukE
MGPTPHPIAGDRPAGNVAGLTMETVRERFRSTSPQTVAEAGHAYAAAASKLAEAQKEIAEAVKYLGDRWKGPAATEALQVLNKFRSAAEELVAKTGQTGKALQLYGEKILPWYQRHLPEDGFINDDGDDKYAQKLMARLNLRIAQTYDGFPKHVKYSPLDIRAAADGTGALGSAGGSGSGSVSGRVSREGHQVPSSSGIGRGNGWPPGAEGSDGTGLQGGRDGTGVQGVGDGAGSAPVDGMKSGDGTDLAGVPSTGGGAAGPGAPLGSGGGADPGGVGGRAVGGGPGPIPPTSMRSGGALPSVPGRGLGAESWGRGGRLRPGTIGTGSTISGAPMAPGSGTGQSKEQERERTTWLTEDRDVWDDDDAAVPPVIGCLEPQDSSHGHTGLDLDDLSATEESLSIEDQELEIAELELEDDRADAAHGPALDDDLDELLDDLLDDDSSGSSAP